MLFSKFKSNKLSGLDFDKSVPSDVQTIASKVLELVLDTPLFNEVYQKAIKDGKITVSFLPAHQLDSYAEWSAEDRTIRIRENNNDPLISLLFELCNAANPGWKNRRNPLSFSTANAYAEHEETIEFESAKTHINVLKNIKKNAALMLKLEELGINEKDLSEAIASTPGEDLRSYLKGVNDKTLLGLGYAHADIYRKAYDQAKSLNQAQTEMNACEARRNSAFEKMNQAKFGSSEHNSLREKFMLALTEVETAMNRVKAAKEKDYMAPYRMSVKAVHTSNVQAKSFASSKQTLQTNASSVIAATAPKTNPSYEESMAFINGLKNGYPMFATLDKDIVYYLNAGQCYLPDILKGAIDGSLTENVKRLSASIKTLGLDDKERLCQKFIELTGFEEKDPIAYAKSRGEIFMASYLEEVLGAAIKNVNQTKTSTQLSTAKATYAPNAFTPSYRTPAATPTFEESMALAKNLKKGLQVNAQHTFEKHIAYYLGAGQCYLPEILKGAIDGGANNFVEFLIEKTASFKIIKKDELYKSFAALEGCKGKSPADYATHKIHYVISNMLQKADKASENRLALF